MVRSFDVELHVENQERLAEILDMDEDFRRRANGLFLDLVFQIHKYLIRVTPEDTGELRGGWASILRKYNQDYSKQIRDTTLYDAWKSQNVTPYSREYHFDAGAAERGLSQSSYEDLPLDITVINAVPQGEYMEYGTSRIQGRHFTELARYKGEFWFNHVFEEWFNKIASEGKISQPDSQADNDIPV
jgi:hypothetical protein